MDWKSGGGLLGVWAFFEGVYGIQKVPKSLTTPKAFIHEKEENRTSNWVLSLHGKLHKELDIRL